MSASARPLSHAQLSPAATMQMTMKRMLTSLTRLRRQREARAMLPQPNPSTRTRSLRLTQRQCPHSNARCCCCCCYCWTTAPRQAPTQEEKAVQQKIPHLPPPSLHLHRSRVTHERCPVPASAVRAPPSPLALLQRREHPLPLRSDPH